MRPTRAQFPRPCRAPARGHSAAVYGFMCGTQPQALASRASAHRGFACACVGLQIVAGLEPENTNILLQMLGKACRKSNGADAVKVSFLSRNGLYI